MNIEIAEIFYKIADILELKDERWKPQAYRVAAQTLESLKEDVLDIYLKESKRGLEKLPGIGGGLAKKIVQYIENESIEEYEKLKKSVPSGILEMMDIPGVGVKKARLFYSLGIKSIKELKKAALQKKLRNLLGFKEKSEEKILEGISMSEKKKERIPLLAAGQIANKIVKELENLKEVEKIVVAGSIRRKKPTIGDIDIVVLTSKPEIVAGKFVKISFVKEVLGKGKEKATIISKEGMQVDLRFFSKENFGSGLLYFTGDKQHNIWLRKIAIKKRWKLNEYGLFQGKKRIAGKNEEEIYEKLGLRMPKPENRIGETPE